MGNGRKRGCPTVSQRRRPPPLLFRFPIRIWGEARVRERVDRGRLLLKSASLRRLFKADLRLLLPFLSNQGWAGGLERKRRRAPPSQACPRSFPRGLFRAPASGIPQNRLGLLGVGQSPLRRPPSLPFSRRRGLLRSKGLPSALRI